MAVIGDKIYTVGDSVEGAVITAIQPQGISVKFGEKTIIMSVPKEGKISYSQSQWR